jgi:hypothetical protein
MEHDNTWKESIYIVNIRLYSHSIQLAMNSGETAGLKD